MTDAELVEQLRSRPEQGCRYLLEQYTGLVLSICRNKLGGICTEQDIEELASDILFEFWQKREKIDLSKSSVGALLSGFAKRRCVDYYRSNGKCSIPEELDETIADPGGSPDHIMLGDLKRTALLDAVIQLGEPDTEIIIRKYYHEETAAQIASRLGMRTGTVEMRLLRARKRLKRLLGGEENANG